MPALNVNIIIVHPWDVVFPRENNTPRVNNYDVHLKCFCLMLTSLYKKKESSNEILYNLDSNSSMIPEEEDR
jgi:hypothetical protein